MRRYLPLLSLVLCGLLGCTYQGTGKQSSSPPPQKTTPVITWASPAAITVGTALSSVQLDATASVQGQFTYSPALGSIPPVGNATLSVLFTPSDLVDYTTAQDTVVMAVNAIVPASSVIVWSNPSPIGFGSPLTNVQLNATANTPGVFTYKPVIGSILPVGTDILSVLFTPTDIIDFTPSTKSVSLVVNKSATILTWNTPSAITVGTPLSGIQLNATSNTPGTFVYTPAIGTVLPVGSQSLSVAFTPTDIIDFPTASKTVNNTVNSIVKTTPVITWAAPAPITYGTLLDNTELNATASVAGSFTYTPPIGSRPNAGSNTLSVLFTPTDLVHNTTNTASVTLVVSQAVPVITWKKPTNIVYGTSLSNTQLDASTTIPGVFTYTPLIGSTPTVGNDTLSVLFTPTDTIDYTTATKSVVLTVTQASSTLSWATPTNIVVGTALSSTQLNATDTVPGSFVYTPPVGTVLPSGNNNLSVVFTPTDKIDYQVQTASVSIGVTKITPIITWATPGAINAGTVLGATQLDATTTVPGLLVYTPAAGTIPATGTDLLSVSFTPTDTNTYNNAADQVSLVVNSVVAVAPTITWATPAAINYGTAISGSQLNATANVPGVFAYTPSLGTITDAGPILLSVIFTPNDLIDYKIGNATVILNVNKATLNAAVNNSSDVYGTVPGGFTANFTGFVNGDGAGVISGSPSFNTTATSTSDVGSYPVTAGLGSLAASNYTFTFTSGTLTITQATPVIEWDTPNPFSGAGVLGLTQLDATANVAGVFTYTPPAGTTIKVTTTLNVSFVPTNSTDYVDGSGQVTLVVNNTATIGAISFNFDDGFLSFYQNAFLPIFNNPAKNPNGYLINAFIITNDGVSVTPGGKSPTGATYGPDMGGAPGYITDTDLMDMYNSGLVEVSDHTRTHPYLTTCDLTGKITCGLPKGQTGRGQFDEIIGAQVDLFNYWGITANTFAYPYGDFGVSWTAIPTKASGMACGNTLKTCTVKVDTIDILNTDGVGMSEMTYPSLTGLSGGITPFVGARTTESGNTIGDNAPLGADCGPTKTTSCPFPSLAYKLSGLIVDTADNFCFNTADTGCSTVPTTCIGTNPCTIQAEIDSVQLNGNWLILVMHKVDDATDPTLNISSTVIQEIVDYCVLKNVNVLTQSQGVAKYGLPR